MRRARQFLSALLSGGLLLFAGCGGGGGNPLSALGAGPTFTGQIVAGKKTAGTVQNFVLQQDVAHLAYNDTGLVTMKIDDLSDLRVMRLIDDVIANDVARCGGLLYVLTYRDPPTLSTLITFDVAADRFVPQRLGEIQLLVEAGARLACKGNTVYLGGGTQGLIVIDARNPRVPVRVTLPADPEFEAIAFHNLIVSGNELRAIVDLGGVTTDYAAELDCRATPAPLTPDCTGSPPPACWGKFGIRSFDVRRPTELACAGGWDDFRIPDSQQLEFPPASGINTSPTSHPIAMTEDASHIYIASNNGRRLTIATSDGAIVFSGDIPGISQGQISALDIFGDVLVLTDGNVRIIDVSDRARPFLSSTVFTPGRAFSVRTVPITGEQNAFLAYVADGDNGVVVVRIARNFFLPLRGDLVAREIPRPQTAAPVPDFEETSPLFGTQALVPSEERDDGSEGVLAAGRLLIGSAENLAPAPFDTGTADTAVPGTLLSVEPTGSTIVPLPAMTMTAIPGPFGLNTERVRVFSQNSLCLYTDDGGMPPLVFDPVCADSMGGLGHFLEFPDAGDAACGGGSCLTYGLQFAAAIVMDDFLPGRPGPSPIPDLIDPSVGAITPPLEQIGRLSPLAVPTAIVMARDGLVAVANSGLDIFQNPTPMTPNGTTPFTATPTVGRIAILDENGRPYAYRRMAEPRPFDPVAFRTAVVGGVTADQAALAPYPMFPKVQLRDDAGNLLLDGMMNPLTPDSPPTGVLYGDEDLRNDALLPAGLLPVTLTRTSLHNNLAAPGELPPFDTCSTVDADPLTVVPSADPDQDERSSLGLCHGVFGLAYGGTGPDQAQPNESATPDFDYYTRNPIYFATTGDGGVVQIDLDSGISQVSPPGTLVPLLKTLNALATQLDPSFSNPDPMSSDLVCDPLLAQIPSVRGEDERLLAFAGATVAPDPMMGPGRLATPLDCDPFLRMGLTYVPATRTLFVANPLGRSVTSVFLSVSGSASAQGLLYQSGRIHLDVGGFLNTPVDVVPVEPLPVSTTMATESSDLYVADRGSGTIVRITQSGQFVAVRRPIIAGQPVAPGTLAGLAISPDGETLYLTLSEGCGFLDDDRSAGCVATVDPF